MKVNYIIITGANHLYIHRIFVYKVSTFVAQTHFVNLACGTLTYPTVGMFLRSSVLVTMKVTTKEVSMYREIMFNRHYQVAMLYK